jgi:hypothetical protein
MGWFNTFKKDKSAIVELSNVIFKSSLDCAEALKNYLNDFTEKERQERWIYILFEFIYFFMHMTNRIAFGKLGNEGRIKLQDELAPLIIGPTIESLFGHWPRKLKQGIKNDFYEKLNDAEIEYSGCNELLSKDHPFTSDKALFSKLARNVAELSGHSNNPAMLLQIITVSVDAWKNMKLEELVVAVGKEL